MKKQLKPKIFFSNDMIEQQVTFDLMAFQKIIKKPVRWPVDLEFYVKNLWGLEIDYLDEINDKNSDESIVGCLNVKSKFIQINLSQNESEGRINFTISHEAGHASLHSTLSISTTTNEIDENIFCRKSDKNINWRIEQQANHYACCLLMPKIKLFEQIDPDSELDLNLKSAGLMQAFAVSRYALELRLHKLGFKTINKKYIFT